MQYHLNGFRPGDPRRVRDGAEPRRESERPGHVDVLIVGSGPAGLTLAAQLATFGEITTRIVEAKPGPLKIGQADGVACRSMEMFEAFGFADRVEAEAYWVNETTFWRPDPANPDHIARFDRIQDVEDGLSEFPHTILSQARIHDFFLETMANSPGHLEPVYSRRFVSLEVDHSEADKAYPVAAVLERLDAGHEGEFETLHARYAVGCDGARSQVRDSIGVQLDGDSANKVWGVMDVLAVTDFPDIRLKSAIQSSEHGSVLVIPREGGYMVRLYTELGQLDPGERARDRSITAEQIIEAAQRIFSPYTLDVREVSWWSAYEIGQRLADTFDDVPVAQRGSQAPRVFITGDACHTHSPKAGQGMNVSMADSFNLGWKLASVLAGTARPELLQTYSAERQAVAAELIEFDRDMARLFSVRSNTSSEQAEFQRYFAKHGRYTAGVETQYGPSMIQSAESNQDLATGFTIGRRFHSAPVTRLGDAKPVHLGHTVKADGRWRIFAFADDSDPTAANARLAALCDFLESDPSSPVLRFTSAARDVDSVIDVRAVLQQPHRSVALEKLPAMLFPRKGIHGLIDYEKVFCPAPSPNDVFEMRGIDRAQGCVVVVRPDQYVSAVLPLDAHDEIAAFFGGILTA